MCDPSGPAALTLKQEASEHRVATVCWHGRSDELPAPRALQYLAAGHLSVTLDVCVAAPERAYLPALDYFLRNSEKV